MGLPQSGKTSLYNSLTNSTRNENKDLKTGTVKVPDINLEKISKWYDAEKKVYGEISITDPESNMNFDSSSDFLEKKNLQEIQKFDGVILVIRSFKNDSIPHPYGEVNFMNDIEQFVIESRLIDAQIIEKRVSNLSDFDKSLNKQEKENIEKKINKISEEERGLVDSTFLMSKAPIIIILNSDEGEPIDNLKLENAKSLLNQDTKILQIPLKFEEELIGLSNQEIDDFRNELGIENNIDRFYSSILDISETICFLTAGKKECRSWILKKGSSAVEAAGKIHSDIARGFVRAEVVHIDEILKYNSEKEAKEKGIIKGEGKNYIINSGDVINFLFSV
jgi:ribosome-binding ATPase YchF (GTP1/OBG family)